ncbi:MAG: methionine adenosyltransferase domain-containing protein [Alphaproteobacteria bacterium]
MKKTAEYVSLGHPDKTADFISSYILDQIIKEDKGVKYALEVMVKDNTVILGGEVKTSASLDDVEIYVKNAIREVGYNEAYSKIWGHHALDVTKLNIINLIGLQSPEINYGVEEQQGWGDQGVFVGYATQGEGYLNKELYLAKKLNNALYYKAKKETNLGLDIKTQITLDDNGDIETAVVAIPMLEKVEVADFVIEILGETPKNLIVNGAGAYSFHSSIADCGITGRKLACDFYSTACPIGGGSPWTKDASKADLTLNLYARKLAVENLKDNDECFVYLSSCIGRAELPSAVVKTIKDGKETSVEINVDKKPFEIIHELGLDNPVYADLCKNGLVSL